MSIPTGAPLPAAQQHPAYAPYTQQGEHPRKAPLSGRARALTITIIVCNALLPIAGLEFHYSSFADIAAYMTVITLAVIYLVKKTTATRYALAGVSVIILFVAFPILAACLGGHYVYLTFIVGSVSIVKFAIGQGIDGLPDIIIAALPALVTLTWLLCAIGLLRPDKAPRSSMAMPTPLNAPIPYGALIAPSSVSGIVANTGPITGPGVSQYAHGQVSHAPVNMQYGYGYAASPAEPIDRRKSRRLSALKNVFRRHCCRCYRPDCGCFCSRQSRVGFLPRQSGSFCPLTLTCFLSLLFRDDDSGWHFPPLALQRCTSSCLGHNTFHTDSRHPRYRVIHYQKLQLPELSLFAV